MTAPSVIEQLSARQAKVLRYVVSTRTQPVTPDKCVVLIEWSDLPKTYLQALKVLSALRQHELIERVGKHQFIPTDAGREAVKYMNTEKLWQQAPPPKVTNKFLHTEKPKPKKKGKQ